MCKTTCHETETASQYTSQYTETDKQADVKLSNISQEKKKKIKKMCEIHVADIKQGNT